MIAPEYLLASIKRETAARKAAVSGLRAEIPSLTDVEAEIAKLRKEAKVVRTVTDTLAENFDGVSARIDETKTLLLSETSALAERIAQIEATADDGSLARVESLEQAFASERIAQATLNQRLTASVGRNESRIEEVRTVLVTDTEAIATRTTTLESQVQTPTTGLLARVSTVETTYATQTFAEAKKTEAISAAAADATAKVSTETSARVAADGAIHARWGVAIDVNGRVVGRVNLDGTNQTSQFKVSVDKFVVENANGTVTAMDIRAGGKIVFGADIQSDNYDGTNGWRLTRAGDLEANSGTFRGLVRIGSATAFGTGTGIWMGMDGGVAKFRVGDPAGARIVWDGSNFTVVGLGVDAPLTAFVDSLEAFRTGGNSSLTTTDAYGVTPAGGNGTYTYSWQRVSGSSAITAQSSTSRFTKFTSSGGTNEVLEAYFKCVVTSDGESVDSDQIRVEFIHGTPP